MATTERRTYKTTPWSEIRKQSKVAPEQRAKTDRAVEGEMARIRIGDLRKARELSQATMADLLGMNQGDVSKLERRADMYLSTLRRYIEALGGELHLTARFDSASDVEIEIPSIGEIGDTGPRGTTSERIDAV